MYCFSKLIGSPIHLVELDEAGSPSDNRLAFGEGREGQTYGFYLKHNPLRVYYDMAYGAENLTFVDLQDETRDGELDDDDYEDVEYLESESEEENNDEPSGSGKILDFSEPEGQDILDEALANDVVFEDETNEAVEATTENEEAKPETEIETDAGAGMSESSSEFIAEPGITDVLAEVVIEATN